MYEIHKDLIVQAGVGWTIYNTLRNQIQSCNGYVLKAEEMTKTFTNMKLGSYKDSIQNANQVILSLWQNAHVYIVLAVCEDGSFIDCPL